MTREYLFDLSLYFKEGSTLINLSGDTSEVDLIESAIRILFEHLIYLDPGRAYCVISDHVIHSTKGGDADTDYQK